MAFVVILGVQWLQMELGGDNLWRRGNKGPPENRL